MLLDENRTTNEPIQVAFKNTLPVNATIELLTRCNLRCEHCYIPAHTGAGLTYEQITSILDQLHEMGTLYLLLTGGEMFLRPDIMDIVRYARRKGFSVTLFSNATCTTEAQIAELKELNIAQFSCTIFSMNPEVHDAITGVKGSLEKTLRTMALVKQYGIPGEIKNVIMKRNLADWKAVHDYAKENGFSHLAPPNVMPKIDGNLTPMELGLNYEQTKEVWREQDERGMQEKVRIGWDESDYICNLIHTQVFIDCNGNLFPCNTFYYKFGNILELPLREIWNKAEAHKYLLSLRKKDFPACCNCKDRAYCVKCPGNAYMESGDLYACSEMDRRLTWVTKELYGKEAESAD